jgi:hypothetical protein
MREVDRIARQLQKTIEGKAWHGPAVAEALDGITAELAARPGPGGTHSIWQIVLHMDIWQDAVGRWLAGDASRPNDEDSWPAITDTSETAWRKAVASLRSSYERLRAEVPKLHDARLSDPIVDNMSSIYSTLHGVIHHNLYHAGQIALLKKAGGRGH